MKQFMDTCPRFMLILIICGILSLTVNILDVYAVLGDVDEDEDVDFFDGFLCDHVMGLTSGDWVWYRWNCADLNQDGGIDIQDRMIIANSIGYYQPPDCPDYTFPKSTESFDGDDVADWFYYDAQDDFTGNKIEMVAIDQEIKYYALLFTRGADRYFIGKCPFGGGINSITYDSLEMYFRDGKRIVRFSGTTHTSFDGGIDQDGDGKIDKWVYEFNFETEKLTYRHYEDDQEIETDRNTIDPPKWPHEDGTPGNFNDLPPYRNHNPQLSKSDLSWSEEPMILEDSSITFLNDPWKPIFDGLGGYPIVDFAIYNGKLYAVADSAIYVYDGSSWNIIDAPTHISSIESYEDKLIVGGKGGLYAYEGASFNLIFPVASYIKTLGVFQEEAFGPDVITLYAGTMLDESPTLYYCNGSAGNSANWHVDPGFSSILNSSGPFGSIDSFAEYNHPVYNDTIYVTSGGTIYNFNGTDWSIVKTFDAVYSFLDMKVHNDKLYLATRDDAWRTPVYQGGSGFGGRVIEFDGTNWTTVFNHYYWIYSLEEYNNKLYAGTANQIFTFNGTSWETSFISEETYYVITMITYDGKVFAGMGNGYIFVDPFSKALQTNAVVVLKLSPTNVLAITILVSLAAVVILKKSAHMI